MHRRHSKVHSDLRQAKQVVLDLLLPAKDGEKRRTTTYVSSRSNANVTAVGIGPKMSGGVPTGGIAVRVYVHRKLPGSILGELAIPKRVDGIETDVVVSGPFRALHGGYDLGDSIQRPIYPGVSIGFAHTNKIVTGTLGAIVRRNGDDFLLSNNHVLAFENRLPVGSPILQPGMRDGGALADHQVGELTEFVPLGSSGNQVDAAIATLNVTFESQPSYGVEISSSVPTDAEMHQIVHKLGRSTGYTIGKIVDLAADIPVRFFNKVYRFEDQVLIEGIGKPFADDGDSGALVVDRGTGVPTALLFAGSIEFAAANHLTDVISALGVEIVID